MDASLLNWPAILVGTIAAFALGMLWFSPRLFGRAWAKDSHDLTPPASPPVLAMLVTLIGLGLLAFAVGMTETNEAIGTAIAIISAVALTVAGMDLFSQKGGRAVLIDAGYIVASGAFMILAQGLL